MSYGDYNFAPPHVDTFRLMLLLCVLAAGLSLLLWAAYNDLNPPRPPAEQHAPRNLPEGNTHLLQQGATHG